MQLLMGDVKVVILCQSGGEHECRPLLESLNTILQSTLGGSTVVLGDDWNNMGSTEAVSLYEAIANAKVTISIFAKPVDKSTQQSCDKVWKRIDEYAWYNCLTYNGPPQQQPKYIPICLQNNSREYFAQHLRTLRIGRLPKDWAQRLMSTPKTEWSRSVLENLRAIIKALNNALGTQLVIEDLLRNITFKSDSEKHGSQKPQGATPDQVASSSGLDKKTAESPVSFISFEHTSKDDCTVTVTCSKVHTITIQPDTEKTVVSMNVTL